MIIVSIKKEVRGDKDNQLKSMIITRFVIRGVTAEGYKGGAVPPMELPKTPDREPDAVIENIKLLPYQNALYRLTGDKNLIHIDPGVAAKAGFN